MPFSLSESSRLCPYRENKLSLNVVLPVREFQTVPVQGKRTGPECHSPCQRVPDCARTGKKNWAWMLFSLLESSRLCPYRENKRGLNAFLPVREFETVPIQGKRIGPECRSPCQRVPDCARTGKTNWA